MKEVELAKHIVQWLRDQHYEVYQEVLFGAPVADIVVDVDGRGWVIETKTSFGLSVIGQAIDWRLRGVTRVSVGIPKPKRATAGYHLGFQICKDKGIGVIEWKERHGNSSVSSVKERIQPSFFRSKRKTDIINVCEEAHKTFSQAGSYNGGHWTPYKHMIEQVRKVVAGNGWVRFGDIINAISHHYSTASTARSCLSKNLQTIHKDVFESRRNGKYLEFRLKPEKE